MKNLLFLNLFVLLYLSCNKPEPIIYEESDWSMYLTYSYNANQDETYVKARFLHPGASLNNPNYRKLNAPSIITFNDIPLTLLIRENIYERYLPGFIEEGTFKWVTSEGETFINSYKLDPINLPPDLASIDSNEDLDLTFIGIPIQCEEEIVTLKFYQELGPIEYQVTQEGEGAQSIFVEAMAFQNIALGPKLLDISRFSAKELQDAPNGGGFRQLRYQSKNIAVDFNNFP